MSTGLKDRLHAASKQLRLIEIRRSKAIPNTPHDMGLRDESKRLKVKIRKYQALVERG